MEVPAGNIIKRDKFYLHLKTPRISLGCKIVKSNIKIMRIWQQQQQQQQQCFIYSSHLIHIWEENYNNLGKRYVFKVEPGG